MAINVMDWYWAVAGSTTQVYSSARNIYVPVTDAAYQAWLQANGFSGPVVTPTEANIWPYLSMAPRSMPAWMFNGVTFSQPAAGTYTKSQLISYASQKQQGILVGGTSVAIGGGVNIGCSTDAASLVLLQGANTLATSTPATIFNWVQTTGVPITLTSAQINTMFSSVTSFIQSTFTQLSSVINAINTGKITTPAGVDTPPAPTPAWPVNS